MDKRVYTLLFMLFFGMFLRIAYAEEREELIVSEDDYLGDVPKVLTVSRLSQPLSDVPSAVTIIDRATIRASGIVDLPEIFRLVPGMYVAANAGFVHNTNHVVSYHGMTSAYAGAMQVLINGRSVYSPLYGGVQWSELPLAIADIERIEVTRGPNAASYGANSFFGVINIITQQPTEAPSNSIIATHGNGRNEAFYRHAGKMEDLAYRVTVGYRSDDGFDNRNDFKRTQFLNAQADYRINDKNNLELEFGLADGDREEGEITKDNAIFLPREKDINNHYELIRWRHNVSDDSDFSLQAYHSFDRSDDTATSANLRPAVAAITRRNILTAFENKFHIQPPPAVIASANKQAAAAANALLSNTITIQNPVEAERYDIEAQHNFSIGKKIRVVWGGSLRRDSMYAPHYLGTGETDYFNLQRLFGHVEWQANEKLVLNAGAMVEHNDFTGTGISPRASINFKPFPNHTLRFGISSALRTPNYLEEKFNRSFVIPAKAPFPSILFQYAADKGNVDPERIVSREIGYLGKIGALSLDARLFHDSISDHIGLNSRTFKAPPAFVLVTNGNKVANFANAGCVGTDGFEAQLSWRLASSTNLLLNYAHVNIYTSPTGLPRDFADSMPSDTVSALITHQFDDKWDGSLAYYQTGKVAALGDGDPVGLIRRADVRLARKFNLGARNGEVSAVVENLFDSHYHEFADYNTAKRRARINLSFDF